MKKQKKNEKTKVDKVNLELDCVECSLPVDPSFMKQLRKEIKDYLEEEKNKKLVKEITKNINFISYESSELDDIEDSLELIEDDD